MRNICYEVWRFLHRLYAVIQQTLENISIAEGIKRVRIFDHFARATPTEKAEVAINAHKCS